MTEIKKIKTFYCKVFRLPKNIISEINDYIERGYRAKAICTLLLKYKDKHDIPNFQTFSKYVKWYDLQKQKKPEAQLKQIIQQDASGIKNQVDSIDSYAGKDKKEILEDLVVRMDRRMRLIEETIKSSPDFQFDRVFTTYMREVRAVLETLAKLTGELKDEKTQIINIVRNEMDFTFQWFVDITNELVPEKSKMILDKLSEKINQFQLNLEEKHV